MDKKSPKSWADVQLTIAALAITVTLTLWNLFATPSKTQAATQPADEPQVPPSPPPTEVANPLPQFLPVKIVFSGPAPQQQVVVQAAAPVKKKSNSAPPVNGGTGSSKP